MSCEAFSATSGLGLIALGAIISIVIIFIVGHAGGGDDDEPGAAA